MSPQWITLKSFHNTWVVGPIQLINHNDNVHYECLKWVTSYRFPFSCLRDVQLYMSNTTQTSLPPFHLPLQSIKHRLWLHIKHQTMYTASKDGCSNQMTFRGRSTLNQHYAKLVSPPINNVLFYICTHAWLRYVFIDVLFIHACLHRTAELRFLLMLHHQQESRTSQGLLHIDLFAIRYAPRPAVNSRSLRVPLAIDRHAADSEDPRST